MGKIKKMKGFTLIELIIVIVILGVLTAVVVPKFVDFQRQAHIAVIEQVAGAMRSTSAIAHSKAIVDGVVNGSLTVNNYIFPMQAGYIQGHWNLAWRYALDIGKVIDYTNVNSVCVKNDLCGVGNQAAAAGLPFSTAGHNGLVLIWQKNRKITERCYAYYFNPSDGTEPKVGSVTTGC